MGTLRRIKQGTYNPSISLVTLMDIVEGLHVDIIVSNLEKKLTGGE